MDQPLEKTGAMGIDTCPLFNAITGEDFLNLVPKVFFDDGLMQAGIGVFLVDDLTAIKPVLQQKIKRAAGKGRSAGYATIFVGS